MKTETNWWSDFYEGTLFEEFLARTDDAELNATLDFLVSELELTPGASVFDQCCGFGSISLPLAQRGYNPVGVDLCRKYIAMAQEKARSLDLTRIKFFCADAFVFRAQPLADAGFNWYTSFGYSDLDMENQRMISRASESIKVGGKFALEYPNVAFLLKNFKPEIRRTQKTAQGDIEVVRHCRYVAERGVMTQTWQFTMPDGQVVTKDTSLRLYMPHTIVEMFQRCDFKDVRVYGGFDRQPVTLESPRCIFVGRQSKQEEGK